MRYRKLPIYLKFHTILTRIMLLGNSNRWLYLREIQIQKISYTLSFFLNAIAFSYHQGKRTVSSIREFWDTLYIQNFK
jgi:hypothetical protein